MSITRRRAERRRRAWRTTLALLFLVTLTLGIYYGLHSPYFHVRQVQLHGLHALSEDEVLAWTSLTAPTLLWQVDAPALAARLEDHPRIAGVQVTKAWPDTLTIELLERRALAYVLYGRGWLAVDETGLPFAVEEELPDEALVINGLNLADQPLGRPLPEESQGALLAAMYIAQFDMNWVKEIWLEESGELSLVLRGEVPVRLGGGTTDFQARLAVLVVLWAEWQPNLERVLYFDVHNPLRPAVKLVDADDNL